MRILPVAIAVFGLAKPIVPDFALALPSQTPSQCAESVLPAQVNEMLKVKFPNWRPKQLSDMDAGDQQLWLKASNAKECPGIVMGHFENPGEAAYGILLVPRSNPSGGHIIAVFSKDATQAGYVTRVLDRAEGHTYSGLVISKAEPGKYEDSESTKSVQIKLDGLYVEWMEKGAHLYYWRAGRYYKLQVSD